MICDNIMLYILNKSLWISQIVPEIQEKSELYNNIYYNYILQQKKKKKNINGNILNFTEISLRKF